MNNGLDKWFYPVPVDHQAVAADWAAEGFSFGVMVDPPGQYWEDFVHPTAEYVVVTEGALELEIAGALYRAEAGDRARIAAGAPHSVRTVSRSRSVWLYGYGPKEPDHG